MDFSSSSSSSSSQSHYRSASSVSPANTSTPLPIYDTAPHFPPTENRFIAQEISSSTHDAARFAASSSPSYLNYAYNYSHSAGVPTEVPDRPPEEQTVEEEQEREHMFDKIVTPSDVGKLNRLVIPKQHAEKYFPLDSSSSEKGLLLDFEDRSGKSWRFRYSYWNSSQSYVMTKGWSRFVKEKKLDAGDVVSFQRGVGEEAREHFYIDWRRRPQPPHPPPQIQFQHRLIHHHPPFLLHPQTLPNHRGSVIGYNGLATNSSGYNYSGDITNNLNYGYGSVLRGPVVYMRGPPPPQVQRPAPMVLDSVPVVVPGAQSTRLRLFGVNMVTDGEVNRHSADEEAVEESLQLSLIHGGSGESSTTTTTTELLEKGKSSMSLDFDL